MHRQRNRNWSACALVRSYRSWTGSPTPIPPLFMQYPTAIQFTEDGILRRVYGEVEPSKPGSYGLRVACRNLKAKRACACRRGTRRRRRRSRKRRRGGEEGTAAAGVGARSRGRRDRAPIELTELSTGEAGARCLKPPGAHQCASVRVVAPPSFCLFTIMCTISLSSNCSRGGVVGETDSHSRELRERPFRIHG